MEQQITCINCPVGCRMTVQVEDSRVISVAGNTCKRGEAYAAQECIAPQRMITAVIPVSGSTMPLSVKTRSPIPKKLIGDCMAALADSVVTAPVAARDVIISNVCGTGVDIIATRSV